jgi:hypothetical protein
MTETGGRGGMDAHSGRCAEQAVNRTKAHSITGYSGVLLAENSRRD